MELSPATSEAFFPGVKYELILCVNDFLRTLVDAADVSLVDAATTLELSSTEAEFVPSSLTTVLVLFVEIDYPEASFDRLTLSTGMDDVSTLVDVLILSLAALPPEDFLPGDRNELIFCEKDFRRF